jgi:hypothetical protein
VFSFLNSFEGYLTWCRNNYFKEHFHIFINISVGFESSESDLHDHDQLIFKAHPQMCPRELLSTFEADTVMPENDPLSLFKG